MPRHRMNPDGSIVPEKDLRTLWVIYSDHIDGFWGGGGYLTSYAAWNNDVSQAAAWYEHQKDLAEDVAAKIVLRNPARYLGKVRVLEIKG